MRHIVVHCKGDTLVCEVGATGPAGRLPRSASITLIGPHFLYHPACKAEHKPTLTPVLFLRFSLAPLGLSLLLLFPGLIIVGRPVGRDGPRDGHTLLTVMPSKISEISVFLVRSPKPSLLIPSSFSAHVSGNMKHINSSRRPNPNTTKTPTPTSSNGNGFQNPNPVTFTGAPTLTWEVVTQARVLDQDITHTVATNVRSLITTAAVVEVRCIFVKQTAYRASSIHATYFKQA